MTGYANEGYDEWVDALAEGQGYYLECPEEHGSLPPRRVCPECGSTELSEVPLPDRGTVETYTVTNVASPSFEEDAPYAVAIASFDGVSLTGQVRGVDDDDLEAGLVVAPDVDRTATTDEPVVVFREA
jgi:uncharacterized OB-fold protein